MDLYQIRYFMAIVETGGFTKAAERLFVSQPSLSAGIKKLEQELGVTLFERGGRRAVITTAGKFFLEKATIILHEYEATLRKLKEFQQQPTLRLGTLRTIRIKTLAELLCTFQRQHPNVLFELLDGTIPSLRGRLESGDIDLAITILEDADPQTSLPLFQQRRVLAVSKSHPLAQRSSVRLADLHAQAFIQRSHCELYSETEQLLESRAIRSPIVYRADHEEWAIALVAAGLGITIMPEWQEEPGIVYLPIVDLPLQRTIGLVWRNGQDSAMLHQFRVFAASHNWQQGS
jgi:DNA-binding transcriptional LysR family regulator